MGVGLKYTLVVIKVFQEMKPAMRYQANITSTPFCLREARIVADHLLQGKAAAESIDEIVQERLFGYPSDLSAQTRAFALHRRLAPFCSDLWQWIRSEDQMLARQSNLAAVIGQSYLVGDFMDLEMRELLLGFEKELPARAWEHYLEGCLSKDPEMSPWSESTAKKLKSVTYSILVEAGYLESTAKPVVQRVFVDQSLAEYLKRHQKQYILRCLEVTE